MGTERARDQRNAHTHTGRWIDSKEFTPDSWWRQNKRHVGQKNAVHRAEWILSLKWGMHAACLVSRSPWRRCPLRCPALHCTCHLSCSKDTYSDTRCKGEKIFQIFWNWGDILSKMVHTPLFVIKNVGWVADHRAQLSLLWQGGQDGGPAGGWHHRSTFVLAKGQVSGGLKKKTSFWVLGMNSL